MKKLSIQVAILIFCMAVLMSCKDDIVDPYPPSISSDIFNCHHMETWDEKTTRDALVGEWLWEYQTCASFNSFIEGYVDSLGVVFEFKSDSTLNVYEHGEITQNATWQINGNALQFYINSEPWISQLDGSIYFCDERVMFYAAPVDGCNNYLRKM